MGKKNEKAIWIADEYALDVEMNRALLDMLRTRKVAKPKKAKRIYKDLMAQRAAEEEAMCMGAGKAEVVQEAIARVQGLVEPTKKYFCVKETAPWGNADNVAEFEQMPDGGFHVAVANRHGKEFADINLTPEQFAAFKQWVMEN